MCVYKLNKEEVEIISGEQDFISIQKSLQKELDEIKTGNAVFYSQKETENRLERTISKYENNLLRGKKKLFRQDIFSFRTIRIDVFNIILIIHLAGCSVLHVIRKKSNPARRNSHEL